MDNELIKHLPKSFQIWERIEAEAQRRAEERLQKIIRRNEEKEADACTHRQHDGIQHEIWSSTAK